MEIVVYNNIKISVIQDEFTKLFSYLKLEFSSKLNHPDSFSPKKWMEQNNKSINACCTNNSIGTITITPQMTVTDLEQSFRKIYGLSVQVFRKSGKVWLKTTVTDAWTLEEQNKQGEALSKILILNPNTH